MAEGPRVAVPNSRSHQRDCADGSTHSILLPSADAKLRYGRGHPSSLFASDRVLWRGESRRTQVSASAQVRCDAWFGRAHGIWLGTAHVCRPAFGEARNERHLLRLGRAGGAIPYPAGDSEPEQRPAWVQQADGFRRVVESIGPFRTHANNVSQAGRRRGRTMTGLIERTLGRLEQQLPGRVSRPGDNRYIAATALWAKPIGRMPRAVAHCRTPQDVQLAI